jgi:hypothetical protein
MRVTITCEECGRRHRLERSVTENGSIWIICHDCELPLRAQFDRQEVPAHTTTEFAAVWSNTLDLGQTAQA